MAGGGRAGPECRFTCLSPIRLTSISLFTFALSFPNCFCSVWLLLLNTGRSCPTLEQSITSGAKEQQVWQPLESSTGWNWILLLENSRSETKSKWMILLEQSECGNVIVLWDYMYSDREDGTEGGGGNEPYLFFVWFHLILYIYNAFGSMFSWSCYSLHIIALLVLSCSIKIEAASTAKEARLNKL